MQLFDKLKDFIKSLDQNSFYKYLSAILFALFLLMGLLIWRYYSNVNYYLKKIKVVNMQRKEVADLLGEFETVRAQEKEVSEILEQDTNFKIAQFMLNVIRDTDLGQNNSKEPELVEEELDNEYTEIKLVTSFVNLNMQQLCGLLTKIDQDERVYTKELIITKVPKKPYIDVTLEIATLKPKSTSA